MSESTYFVRLKPYNPKQGYNVTRYFFQNNLFVGGDRPNWYKVSREFAAVCKKDEQENGVKTFDVVTKEEQAAINEIEENRRLVSIGLMAATHAVPAPKQAIDLSHKASGRSEAVPLATGGDLSTRDLNLGAK